MTNDKISARQQRCFYFLNLMYANKLQIGHLSGVEAVKLAKVGAMMLTMARQLGLVETLNTSFTLWLYNPKVGYKHGVSVGNVKALPNGQL